MEDKMDKVILVTGATGGLGRETVKILDEKGYKLAICGRDEQVLSALITELKQDDVLYRAFDLTDYKAATAFVNEAVRVFGRLDVVINNVGANTVRGKVTELHIDDFKQMMDINVYSHINLIQAVYPEIKKTKGHIVEILSTTCLFENEGIASYSASKCAMESMSKTLLKESLDDDVRVTNVYPGGIDTGFRAKPNATYMTPKSVAIAVVGCIEVPADATVHELILRPKVERNF